MNARTEHRRRFLADGKHDVAERRGQAVGGRDGREADDDVADQADSSGLQAFAADSRGQWFLVTAIAQIWFCEFFLVTY